MFFQRGILRLAMIQVTRQLLHPLVQGAAEGHVEFLESAADAEHRHAVGNRGLQQRQGQPIAKHVVPGPFHAGGAIVMMRLDI
ncbi:hypothetical protein D3C76_1372950 [compost metagenome]